METVTTTEIRYCKNPKCNKIIDNSRKKYYCSEICRTRHSSFRQYEKLKDNEEFKNKRNEKNRKYYKEHKEELKPRMRVYGIKYFHKKQNEKKKIEEQKKEPEGEGTIKKEETKNGEYRENYNKEENN